MLLNCNVTGSIAVGLRSTHISKNSSNISTWYC